MPIYEYRCESCGQELEKIQKVSDPPVRDCPACGKASLNKLISASAFRLKGSGWYETDFKTGRKKNLQGEGSAPAKKEDGAPAKKDDASPAKKEGAAPAAGKDAAKASTGS